MVSKDVEKKIKELGLTPKEKAFAWEFASDSTDAPEAVKKAGYNIQDRRSGWSMAYQLKNKPTVKKAIELYREVLHDDRILDAINRRILLTEIAMGRIKDTVLINNSDGSQETLELPSCNETRIKAIKELGKVEGDYVTKIVGSKTDPVTFKIDFGDEE